MKVLFFILAVITTIFAEENLKDAWIVIANGSQDSTEASELYQEHRSSPHSIVYTHQMRNDNWEFPEFLKSDHINGLNKGFWITVALITKHKEVAQEMAAYLQKATGDGYIRKVKVFQESPDIRAIHCKTLIAVYSWSDEESGETGETTYEIPFISVTTENNRDLAHQEHRVEGYGTLHLYSYNDNLIGTEVNFHSGAPCIVNHTLPFESHLIWRIPSTRMKARCWN